MPRSSSSPEVEAAIQRGLALSTLIEQTRMDLEAAMGRLYRAAGPQVLDAVVASAAYRAKKSPAEAGL